MILAKFIGIDSYFCGEASKIKSDFNEFFFVVSVDGVVVVDLILGNPEKIFVDSESDEVGTKYISDEVSESDEVKI